MIILELPWPPSVNHYYRRVGSRTLISRSGRAYRRTVVAQLRSCFPAPLSGRLAVAIDAHPPDRRRRDLDNAQKALLDALQHAGVYTDDSQIDDLAIHRRDPVPGGRVRITITALPQGRHHD
ncbi:MAG: RusA family crossover junction endodeoxyribonuclease [Planctomycetota bacterium]